MTQLPPIMLKPDGAGAALLLSLASARGVSLRTDCGGKGLCGKCKVIVHPSENLSPITEAEQRILNPGDLDAGFRLACQAEAISAVTVTIPPDSQETRASTEKARLTGSFPVDPMVRRFLLDPNLASDDNAKDITTIVKTMVPDLTSVDQWDPVLLRKLSEYWSDRKVMTLVDHQQKGLTSVLSGDQNLSLGFAVDIGTTTVAAYLCDMKSGHICCAQSCANPQRSCGEDVISRIAFARENKDGTRILRDLIVAEINSLFDYCLANYGAHFSDVDEVVVVGNTTMQQLFCGIDPRSLGGSPYLPITRVACDWRAADLGLNLAPHTDVHVFPVISGFVGGDSVGVIVWDAPYLWNQISLIVDIGTNGEIVLSDGKDLWATSCATGPAFEGAHISCGMRAAQGAISKIRMNALDLGVHYEMAGGDGADDPRGICGSGIIDAIAEMRRVGLIRENGRLNEEMSGVISDVKGIGRSFTLVPAESTATGLPIEITLNDVRQIQVAKAALTVGIKLLMSVAGVDRIDRLVLTGAFGARFDWKNAVSIGMLPHSCAAGTVETVVNGAGLGAVMALLDKRHRDMVKMVVQKVKVLELAEHPDFQTEFLAAMDFPPIT